eukprot:SAG31_NODE_802_length_12008_cov_18.741036_10_plen_54_part_00
MHASGVPPADASGSSHEAVDELLGLVEDYPSTVSVPAKIFCWDRCLYVPMLHC